MAGGRKMRFFRVSRQFGHRGGFGSRCKCAGSIGGQKLAGNTYFGVEIRGLEVEIWHFCDFLADFIIIYLMNVSCWVHILTD